MPGLTGRHQGQSMQPADSSRVVTVTADYTVKGYEAVIISNASAGITVTLPSAAEMPGQTLCIHVKTSQAVTVSMPENAIDTEVSDLATAGDYVLLYSDGYGWYPLNYDTVSTGAVSVA